MNYLSTEFTNTTVNQFVKAIEIRRALIAKQSEKQPDAEEVLNEVKIIKMSIYSNNVLKIKTVLTRNNIFK